MQKGISGILLSKLFWPNVRKNCSGVREKNLKFEAESQDFAKMLRSLEQFIQTVKGQNNFGLQNALLTCYWRFLTSNKLEQLLGFRNIQEKLEKYCLPLTLGRTQNSFSGQIF